MKQLLILLILVFTIELQYANAQYSSSIGEVVEVEGTVDVSFKNGPWQKAKINTAIKAGDRLRTGEFSKATVKGPNGQLHAIQEMTTIRFGATLENKPTAQVVTHS